MQAVTKRSRPANAAEEPPWLLIAGAAAVLLLLVSGVVLVVARRRAQDLDGLEIDVVAGGRTVALPPPPPGTRQYRFAVRPRTGGAPEVQLLPDGDPEPAFRLTRKGSGARIRPPAGRAVVLPLDRPRDVTDEVAVVVRAAGPVEAGRGARPAGVDADL